MIKRSKFLSISRIQYERLIENSRKLDEISYILNESSDDKKEEKVILLRS